VPTTDEDRVFEVLDDDECRHLGTTGTGRIGFTDGALPAILPVAFALRDGQVVISARRDSSVVRAVRGAVVAFQVDSYDAAARTGWSVTVVGPTRLASDPVAVAGVEDMQFSWRPPPPDRCYISVQLGLVRGWRMSKSPEESTAAGPSDTSDVPTR
jgi:hypothetical protein